MAPPERSQCDVIDFYGEAAENHRHWPRDEGDEHRRHDHEHESVEPCLNSQRQRDENRHREPPPET
jgi:hypothetical protein